VLHLALSLKFVEDYNAACTRAGLHKALTTILEPLKDALARGFDVDYVDGFFRYCFFRLAA
jgi:hypothetical protein